MESYSVCLFGTEFFSIQHKSLIIWGFTEVVLKKQLFLKKSPFLFITDQYSMV